MMMDRCELFPGWEFYGATRIPGGDFTRPWDIGIRKGNLRKAVRTSEASRGAALIKAIPMLKAWASD